MRRHCDEIQRERLSIFRSCQQKKAKRDWWQCQQVETIIRTLQWGCIQWCWRLPSTFETGYRWFGPVVRNKCGLIQYVYVIIWIFSFQFFLGFSSYSYVSKAFSRIRSAAKKGHTVQQCDAILTKYNLSEPEFFEGAGDKKRQEIDDSGIKLEQSVERCFKTANDEWLLNHLMRIFQAMPPAHRLSWTEMQVMTNNADKSLSAVR